MNTLKRRLSLAIASAIVSLAVVVPAQSALARPVTTQGCQSNPFYVYGPFEGGNLGAFYYCSGVHYENRGITSVHTGPWC